MEICTTNHGDDDHQPSTILAPRTAKIVALKKRIEMKNQGQTAQL